MTDRAGRSSYTFGDTPLAVQRLLMLAQVFEPVSRAFLAEHVTDTPQGVLDLGCGPGASTRVVAEETGAAVLGLDASAAFVEVAARDVPAGVEFVCHDATRLPLPRAPVDLIYCRLLLAHLADVAGKVAGFVSQLRPGGLLLVDEMEWIDAPLPALATYERIVVDLVESRGAPMYAGPIVASLEPGDGWERRANGVRVLPIRVADAARLYRMNLATWRDDPHVRAHYEPAEIDQLGNDLGELAESPAPDAMTWGVRQVVFART